MPDPTVVTGLPDVIGLFVGSGGGTVGGGALVWYLMHKKGATQETADINALDKRLAILESRTMDKLDALGDTLAIHGKEEAAFRIEVRERFLSHERELAQLRRAHSRGD